MEKLVVGKLPVHYYDYRSYMLTFAVGEAEARRMAMIQSGMAHYSNETYLVEMSPTHVSKTIGWPSMVHIAIRRQDHRPVTSWNDMQEIKNELVGAEHEAIEIYPAESRLVDMSNQRHLWVFIDKDFQIPMGWLERMVDRTNNRGEQNG